MPIIFPWKFVPWFLVILGVMCVGGAALDLNVFMNHPAAERFVEGFGRNGARIFYIVLGLILGGIGIYLITVM